MISEVTSLTSGKLQQLVCDRFYSRRYHAGLDHQTHAPRRDIIYHELVAALPSDITANGQILLDNQSARLSRAGIDGRYCCTTLDFELAKEAKGRDSKGSNRTDVMVYCLEEGGTSISPCSAPQRHNFQFQPDQKPLGAGAFNQQRSNLKPHRY